MNKTIAYITDIHLDEPFVSANGVDPRANWKIILDDVKKRNIDTIIYGGDIGEATANAWFFDTLSAFKLDLTLGNHDTFTEASKHFTIQEWQGKTEGYYSKEDDLFVYLYLDSSSDVISKEQVSWLLQETLTSKPILLFIHHPIFAVHTAVDKAYPLQNRKTIQNILQQRTAATSIFCGHYHMADEQCFASIQQWVTPAASYQIIKEASELQLANHQFGYRLIHFNGEHVTTEIIGFTNDSAST